MQELMVVFSLFFPFLPIHTHTHSHLINGIKSTIFRITTSYYCITTYTYTYTLPYTSKVKMAKGKNHDRKANPGFGKTNGKANASTRDGEFTLKRVKG